MFPLRFICISSKIFELFIELLLPFTSFMIHENILENKCKIFFVNCKNKIVIGNKCEEYYFVGYSKTD